MWYDVLAVWYGKNKYVVWYVGGMVRYDGTASWMDYMVDLLGGIVCFSIYSP